MLVLVLSITGCNLVDENNIVSTSSCSGEKIKVSISDREYCVEVADDNLTRSKGLMWREMMPNNDGMLFKFDDEQYLSFWMKNTLIPLDILFFNSEKKLVDFKNDFEPCKTINCETFTTDSRARYAVEVNADQFENDLLDQNIDLVIGE